METYAIIKGPFYGYLSSWRYTVMLHMDNGTKWSHARLTYTRKGAERLAKREIKKYTRYKEPNEWAIGVEDL